MVGDDLDGDGRVDLLVTDYETWPRAKQRIRIFRNAVPNPGNWIGFRFQEERGAPSPLGARITVLAGGRRSVRILTSGDSYRSEHALNSHFGLGTNTAVEGVEIRWSSGMESRIPFPEMNRYHSVRQVQAPP